MLAKMRCGDFIWPINPEKLEIKATRSIRVYKFPMGGFAAVDLGLSGRVITGTGEFTGPDAYDSFRRLSDVFSEGGTSWLEHPVWPPMRVYFSELRLREEPEDEYVSYSFKLHEYADSYPMTDFTATAPGSGTVKYTSALSGDTLSSIATRYSKTSAQLRTLNPQLGSDATLSAGQIIRIS